jgi:hypothetical protein
MSKEKQIQLLTAGSGTGLALPNFAPLSPPSLLSFTTMSPTSTTDTAPPPSYLFLEEFDRKTSQAMQNAPEVDEDDWEVYDPAAFEENDERSPPSSSSARILGSNTNRHGRRGRRRSSARVLPPTPLKVRS